jgi:hypothetical protein
MKSLRDTVSDRALHRKSPGSFSGPRANGDKTPAGSSGRVSLYTLVNKTKAETPFPRGTCRDTIGE